MYTKSMKIEFIPLNKQAELIVPSPKPAKSYIPDWYKDIPATKKIEFGPNGEMANDIGSIKRCMPFFDGLTNGYIQESWCDINIQKDSYGKITYAYALGPEIVKMRLNSSMEIQSKFYPSEFTWILQWLPRLPKGWSALFTTPFNRFDLPFTNTTGVIDSDVFFHTNEFGGNLPFYMDKDFEGIIPAGTPMYQIIPFKRENWKSEEIKFDHDESVRRMVPIRKHFINGYKKTFWQKKYYE